MTMRTVQDIIRQQFSDAFVEPHVPAPEYAPPADVGVWKPCPDCGGTGGEHSCGCDEPDCNVFTACETCHNESRMQLAAGQPPLSVVPCRPKIMLCVPSMERHTSDEGWQLALALQAGGYELHGHGLGLGTNVREIVAKRNPSVVFVADQHNWDASLGNPLAIKEERFHGIEALAERPDIFKLTTVQDSHRQRESSKRHATVAGCHAIVTYYHPSIVCHNLSWIRPQHVIRTWHTLDATKVPPFNYGRYACLSLLSGSLGGAYPLRERVHKANLPNVAWLRHPGYVNTGSSTAAYLQTLSQHKVAICTSSRFGYALRKIMEAAACGCIVVTDLPTDDVLPEMDEFIVRVDPDIHLSDLRMQLQDLCDKWNPDQQTIIAARARSRFDFRAEGKRLTMQIEHMRTTYNE